MVLTLLNKRHSIVLKVIVSSAGILMIAFFLWGALNVFYLGTERFAGSKAGVYLFHLTVFTLLVLAAMAVTIYLLLLNVFVRPIFRIISGANQMANGQYDSLADIRSDDEIGRLAQAIHRMGQDIIHSQQELKRRIDEYQRLFELVPCIISLQDRDFRLIAYNREFSDHFDPQIGDYCYHAYKGRDRKCENCPVEKTFADGRPHYSEETGRNKDGSPTHWIVKTAPMRDDDGKIIGAMEMSLDITHKKELESRLAQSEKKYYAIFNNIPNPVFVLDADTLEILDCNGSVGLVYGYSARELLGRCFLELFPEEERQRYAVQVKQCREVAKVRHLNRKGEIFFVQIQCSPSEYEDRRVILVTASDITDRLDAELKLIQAGKMATLGEMATGIAHELNQPLTVIKTASTYFMKKVRKQQPIEPNILNEMASEIDRHVDRAANIINHLRQFGRKSNIDSAPVQVNTILLNAFEMFSQQLKLREIDVQWDLDEALPMIMAESGRLEQVFINLLLNARDAIEEKWQDGKQVNGEAKQISLKSYVQGRQVVVEVVDTGIGIPVHRLDRVFEPFYTTKKVGDGTGIGLSISYGIVKDFGGTIRVASEPLKRTCFSITFPVGER
jgi:histidine kinase